MSNFLKDVKINLDSGKGMVMEILLKEYADGGRLLGTRQIAFPIRDKVKVFLNAGENVTLDFSDTNPTQSFIDELVGVLIIEQGQEILDRLIMKNCSDDIKAILHFVVGDRLDQFENRRSKSVASVCHPRGVASL